MHGSQQGSPSYNDLASSLDYTTGCSVSKQAVWKRFNEACLRFFEAVLEKLIILKTPIDDVCPFLTCKDKRILVQDSTIIKVPARLYKVFSGVKNAHSTVCNARIQGTYDLLSGRFVSFSIDAYSKNDLAAAPELELKEGDLVLRDRGYLTMDEIERHTKE